MPQDDTPDAPGLPDAADLPTARVPVISAPPDQRRIRLRQMRSYAIGYCVLCGCEHTAEQCRTEPDYAGTMLFCKATGGRVRKYSQAHLQASDPRMARPQ